MTEIFANAEPENGADLSAAAAIAKLTMRAADEGMLAMWTVYDQPSDYPDHYVARCHIVGNGGIQCPTYNIVKSNVLQSLRATMRAAGLSCLSRHESDDPKIVETWL
jgi:hypothetical protein